MKISPISLSLLLSALWMVSACQKNPEFLYQDDASVHFVEPPEVEFTFSKHRTDEVLLHLPVEVGGYATSHARAIEYRILEDSTTAVAGIHYRIENADLALPADSFRTSLRLMLLNDDPALKEESRSIYIQLLPNEHFITGVAGRQHMKINMSDILLKPVIWESRYAGFFGSYSQVKHRAILMVCNITDIPDVYDGGPFNYKWDAYGRAVNNYFKENYPIYDENNQIIEPWM